MFTIPNQLSLPKAYTQFSHEGRLSASGNRDRLVDCMEELVKYTWVMRPHFESWGDIFSGREGGEGGECGERREGKGREGGAGVKRGGMNIVRAA